MITDDHSSKKKIGHQTPYVKTLIDYKKNKKTSSGRLDRNEKPTVFKKKSKEIRL